LGIVNKMRRSLVFLIVLLFIGGNAAYADETGNTTLEETNLTEIEEVSSINGSIVESTPLESEEPIKSMSIIQKIMKIGPGNSVPGGSFIRTNNQANKVAKTFGYKNAEAMKGDLLSGQRDKIVSHYNIYQVTEKGKIRGDIYLQHTRTRVFYKTTFNYHRPNDIRPLQ
jgi:hypothetical protein